MTTEPSNEVPDASGPTDTDLEIAETGMRPDLVWDNEAPGLCVRVLGNGEKSFIFVYRRDNRQRFVRIGNSPMRSREAARKRAKELRAVIDQGGNPEIYNQERDNFRPINHETNKFGPSRTSSDTSLSSWAENRE